MAEVVIRLSDNPVDKPGAYKRGDLVRAYPDGTVGDVWSPNRPDVLVRVDGMPLDEAQAYCAEVWTEEVLSGETNELGDPVVLTPATLVYTSAYYLEESRLPPEVAADLSTVREYSTTAEVFRTLIEERA